jgi:phage terminase Nu1 subunit (DNA packaging protein)
VIVFHLLDPAELTFPFERAARFRDIELGDELMAVPSVVRQQYLDALNQAVDRFRQDLGSAGIDYQLIDTSIPLDFALMSYLSTRGRTR